MLLASFDRLLLTRGYDNVNVRELTWLRMSVAQHRPSACRSRRDGCSMRSVGRVDRRVCAPARARCAYGRATARPGACDSDPCTRASSSGISRQSVAVQPQRRLARSRCSPWRWRRHNLEQSTPGLVRPSLRRADVSAHAARNNTRKRGRDVRGRLAARYAVRRCSLNSSERRLTAVQKPPRRKHRAKWKLCILLSEARDRLNKLRSRAATVSSPTWTSQRKLEELPH